MNPTPEQQDIIAAVKTRENLVIEAGAGTGKTSTLKMVARAMPQRRGIYIAYNKAIADDAKRSFPTNVTCATAHSFAFRALGKRYADRLNGPRMPAWKSANALGLFSPVVVGPPLANVPGAQERKFSPEQIARLAIETVERFCYSAQSEIEAWMVPQVNGMEDIRGNVRAVVLPVARQAWEDIKSLNGQLKFAHDHYLKMWQLSRPVLPADFVLLDEAQDSNPTVADIVQRQRCQQVLVGDRNQAIYGWRGAIDAMAKFGGRRLFLTQSFRFGEAVAREANKWLDILDAPIRLRGYELINSRLGRIAQPTAVLCRSNSETIAQVLQWLDAGVRVALVGGGLDIRRLAEAAIELKAGVGTRHPELFVFQTWGELQEYVQDESAGSDLKVFVKLVDTYGAEALIAAVDRLSNEEAAEVVVSTAHKAKGREWDTVKIASDFKMPKGHKLGEPSIEPIAPEDAMLAYVSVTRAKLVLDREGLAWVDDFVKNPLPLGADPDGYVQPVEHFPVASPGELRARRRQGR